MKTIKTKIESLDVESIRNYFHKALDESMYCVRDSFEDLEWYEDCRFQDYFQCLEEIWDENDNKVGEGLNFISFSLVIDETNIEEIEGIFEEVRDTVYAENMGAFSNKCWEEHQYCTPYDKEDTRSYDFDKWCEDGEMNSRFDDDVDGLHVYKIWSNTLRNNAINVIYDEDGILHRY
mgnify:CR=1 FL=1